MERKKHFMKKTYLCLFLLGLGISSITAQTAKPNQKSAKEQLYEQKKQEKKEQAEKLKELCPNYPQVKTNSNTLIDNEFAESFNLWKEEFPEEYKNYQTIFFKN